MQISPTWNGDEWKRYTFWTLPATEKKEPGKVGPAKKMELNPKKRTGETWEEKKKAGPAETCQGEKEKGRVKTAKPSAKKVCIRTGYSRLGDRKKVRAR